MSRLPTEICLLNLLPIGIRSLNVQTSNGNLSAQSPSNPIPSTKSALSGPQERVKIACHFGRAVAPNVRVSVCTCTSPYHLQYHAARRPQAVAHGELRRHRRKHRQIRFGLSIHRQSKVCVGSELFLCHDARSRPRHRPQYTQQAHKTEEGTGLVAWGLSRVQEDVSRLLLSVSM